MERKKNTLRNIVWGVVNKIITIVLPFVSRTLLIKILGSEFLGLNSLFTSILQVLNISELGISSAITFCMYKPIADKDDKTICALLNFYKKTYRIIGVIVLTFGIIILPFIKCFINGDIPSSINIYILYAIYLFNTVLSYLLYSYKSSLLIALQRNDIVSNVNSILTIIQFSIQMLLLILFKNYYIYIIILPFITLTNNVICAKIAEKKYPNYICYGNIDKELKNIIKNKVFGLLVYKICAITRNSFDSIFISAFLGLNMVAVYNNYYLIMSSVTTFLSIITTSMLAAVGNSVVVESVDKNYNDMNKFNFIYMWISGWCAICLICLYQPFMELWLGSEYLLSFSSVILFTIYFYSLEVGVIRATYSDAKGLWWETRYRAIIEAILNVILNFVLGKIWGLNGIIVATLLSLLLVNFGYGSTIIFKYYFKDKKVIDYFRDHFKYFFVTLFIAIITYLLVGIINLNGILGIGLKSFVCLIFPNVIYVFIYFRNKYFIDLKNMIREVFKR